MKPRTTEPKITEAMIQRSIMDYLAIVSKQQSLYYFRAGAGAMKTEAGRYFKTGRPGLPDIVVLYSGKFIGLEVKTPTGRQSTAQKNAENYIKDAGGEYHIVRSVTDVKRIVG